jgi:hypothetical protein
MILMLDLLTELPSHIRAQRAFKDLIGFVFFSTGHDKVKGIFSSGEHTAERVVARRVIAKHSINGHD